MVGQVSGSALPSVPLAVPPSSTPTAPTASGGGGMKLPFGLEVASPFDETRPDHNKRLGAFMGFLKMIEEGGTPSMKSDLARLASGAGAGAQTYLALGKQEEEAEIKKMVTEAQLAKAQKRPLKLHEGADGTMYQYDPNDPKGSMTALEGVKGQGKAGEFERMLQDGIDSGQFSAEEGNKLRADYLETKSTGKGGTTVSVDMGASKPFKVVQAKYYEATRDQATGANELLNTVDKMRGALSKVVTGATKPILHPLHAIATDLGVDAKAVGKSIGLDLNSLAGEEDIIRYTKALGLAMGQAFLKGQGTVTNEERRMVEQLAARLGNDPESNMRALDDLEDWAGGRIEKFTVMDKFLNDPKNNRSLWGFDTEWNKTLAEKRKGPQGVGKGGQPSDLTDDEMMKVIQQLGPERAKEIFGQ